jgi:antitoxin component HigA of HigAB toxin-antitoxin module
MQIQSIETELDYETAMNRLMTLMDLDLDHSPEAAAEFDALVPLIEAYERRVLAPFKRRHSRYGGQLLCGGND